MNRLVQLACLNARVAGLAVRGQWLGQREIAAGYDRVAPTYDRVWQCHLRSATDELLAQLPCGLSGTILDLGSGTGYCARQLARTNPEAEVIAVDVSKEMLARAEAGAPSNLRSVVCDMLEFVEGYDSGSYLPTLPPECARPRAQQSPTAEPCQEGPKRGWIRGLLRPRTGAPRRQCRRAPECANVSLIVSTWALGYSHPARLIAGCGRLLPKGGLLAFIVNYRDTLAPVFQAYQHCMLQFPGQVRLAAFPRFPKDWLLLQRALQNAQFEVVSHQAGRKHIEPPEGPLLPWLRQTGILAGFDGMLDLSGPVAAHFEERLAPERENIFHHFAMALARKL